MEALLKGIEREATGSTAQEPKRRAVKGQEEEKLRSLIISTAKTVVGLDGQSRRTQGVLESTAIIPDTHEYLQRLLDQGKEFEQARRATKEKGDMDALRALTPAHERIWITMVDLVVRDESVPKEQKEQVLAYSKAVKSVSGQIITCMVKRCHRQRGWTRDRYRVTLMLVPELRSVQTEMLRAVASHADCEIKVGPPARNPNVRGVVQALVDLGEYEAKD